MTEIKCRNFIDLKKQRDSIFEYIENIFGRVYVSKIVDWIDVDQCNSVGAQRVGEEANKVDEYETEQQHQSDQTQFAGEQPLQ